MGTVSDSTYHPAGVTAIITPWNAPLMLATWRIGPALAAGNTVVLKPPEWAPLTASLLADITKEAGLPDGVFNVVQGTGRDAVRRSPATTASGDSRSRARYRRRGSSPRRRRKTSCRCRSSWVASRRCWSSTTRTSTSRCTWPSNSSTTRARCASVLSGSCCRTASPRSSSSASAPAATLVQGDPRDEATDVSALVSRPHFERVDGFVTRAKAAGARALLGGGPNEELGGLFYAPTILVGAAEGSEILTEEVFGPVLTVQTFSTEDQGVAMANNTRFGLAATLVTGDLERAERVSLALNAGTVWVNCFFVRDLGAPSAVTASPGSAARAASGPSTSTATSRTPCSPNGWTVKTAAKVRNANG